MKPAFLLSCLIFFLFYLISVCPVKAQNELQDFNFQYEKYGPIHETYVKARDSFWTYETLTSRDEMVKATVNFLGSRARVVRTYLQLLKFRLGKTPNVPAGERTYLELNLDKEFTWLTGHEADIQNFTTPTTNDLLAVSGRFEDRQFNWQKLSYSVLANLLLGKINLARSQAEAINLLLSESIIQNPGATDSSTLNQWLETAKDNTYKAGKNIESADAYLKMLDSSGSIEDAAANYQNVQTELEKARKALLGNLPYQREILREVQK